MQLHHHLHEGLRRIWAQEKLGYCLRSSFSMASVMLLCWATGTPQLIIPLFLGIIACALAETDDYWIQRLWTLLVTLACFSVAALAVELLFPYPWLFAIGLGLSAFALVMLGALGSRYAAIANATLILSIYTMIAADQHGGHSFWYTPLLLVAGAAWYGAISVGWQALFTYQPVQQALARVFRELARCFRLKAAMFEPREQMDTEQQRLELARQNRRVVEALNAALEILLHRVGQEQGSSDLSHYLKLYFLAQDLHERVSSSHYPYQALAKAFYHSDILYRCQRLLRLQSTACLGLAESILLRQPFSYGEPTAQAMGELQTALDYLESQHNPAWRGLLHSFKALIHNLSRVQHSLTQATDISHADPDADVTLMDRQPKSLPQGLERLATHFSRDSLIFRHGIRMAAALLGGYAILHLVHPQQGYWILLTTVFVCQTSYGATRTKLVQRISGTLAGLIAGWACFQLFPDANLQALIVVISGVVFFTYRTTHYALATAAITVMVLFCFNQVGDGYGLIIPRLIDTLLGGFVAALAVFIMPDWQGRRLNQVAADVLQANSSYLREIMRQYDTGKQDHLNYRVARRQAHNADARLSATLSNLRLEPGHFRRNVDAGIQFSMLSHTLLGYLSALGAHREAQEQGSVQDALQDELAENLALQMELMAEAIARRQAPQDIEPQREQLQKLQALDADDSHLLVQGQLQHIHDLLPQIRTAAMELYTHS